MSVHLGVRHIRTAGKGSGSVEFTLPASLRDLVGLPCQVTLRDGSRPDIVLRPDFQKAEAAFAVVWQHMTSLLIQEACPLDAFPLPRFMLGLHPQNVAGSAPFLCWRDGLSLAANGPRPPQAASRVIAAFAQAIADDIHIADHLAAGFGAAAGTLLTGSVPYPSDQEYPDLVACVLRSDSMPAACLTNSLGVEIQNPDFWNLAGPLLQRVSAIFVEWSTNNAALTTLRAAWRRGRFMELSGK